MIRTLAACLIILSTVGSAQKPLVCGSDLDNAPFAFVDDDGRPAGRDVEMMQIIAKTLGRPLEWKRMAFAELLPAVEAGTVDCVCATMGITDGRRKSVAFTMPYFETVLLAVVRRGRGEPVRIADLSGRRVAGGIGTTSELAARQRLGGSTVVLENKEGLSSPARLEQKTVDAIVMDGPAAEKIIRGAPKKLGRILEHLGPERYGIVLNKGHSKLLDDLNAALAKHAATWPRLDSAHGLSQVPADSLTPDSVVRALYETISGAAGQKRDWVRFQRLFAGDAKLLGIRRGPTGRLNSSPAKPADFIALVDPILARRGFFESEVSRKLERFGAIAHVFSSYETRAEPGAEPFTRGVNSIQLLKNGDRWRVQSMIWDEERAEATPSRR